MQTQPAAVLLGAPNQRLEFAYDYQGRCTLKKVYVWDSGSQQWTLSSQLEFLYDGWNLITENSTAGSPTTVHRTYTWGLDLSNTLQAAGGVGGLLAVTDGDVTPSSRFPTYDANGNVTEYLTASGAVATQFGYSPFGEIIVASATTDPACVFRFSTKYIDKETNLLYYGYRYYSPVTGRWLLRDPLGEEGGTNVYAFVRNSPRNAADALGLALYAFDGTANVPTDETNVFLTYASGWTGNRSYEKKGKRGHV